MTARLFLFWFPFFILNMSALVQGAFEFKEPFAATLALSGARTAGTEDASAIHINPSGLGFALRPEWSLSCGRVFSLEDLSSWFNAFVLPTRIGGLGLAHSRFGPPVYREDQIWISHGFRIAENVAVGYGLKGFQLQLEEYGRARTFALDLGMSARISGRVWIGMAARNVNRPSIGVSRELLPQGLSGGFLFRPARSVSWSADVERQDENPLVFRSGFEWVLAERVHLRGGAQSDPARLCCGLGLKAGRAVLDYAYSQHFKLPGTHLVSLSFFFGRSSSP